jgi:hypothetical protein
MTICSLNKLSASQYCAFISVLCPIIAISLAALISYSHTDFWNGLDVNDDAGRNAGAIMGAAEGGMILICLAAGFLLGLGLSFFSLALQRSKIGYFSLAFNSVPFVLFFIVLIKIALFGL